jgi:hypothetical protein
LDLIHDGFNFQRTSLFHLNKAFHEFSHHVQFHPAQGYIWETEKSTPPIASGKSTTKEPLRGNTFLVLCFSPLGPGILIFLPVGLFLFTNAFVDTEEIPPGSDVCLTNAQFVSRVDALIERSAAKQHVVLLPKVRLVQFHMQFRHISISSFLLPLRPLSSGTTVFYFNRVTLF